MSYGFKPGEAIPGGARRIVREQLEYAARGLEKARGGEERDKAVHEARKSIKKARAVLRLFRDGLGKAYRKENARLRDLARGLSELRDAAVMRETLDGLVKRFAAEVKEAQFRAVRAALGEDRQEAEAPALIARTAKALRVAAARVDAWPLAGDGFEAIAPGVRETFRRGRRALKAARKKPCPENDHAWRKRVKDHWYHVRLFAGAGWLRDYERELKRLETALGEAHNLAVLRERVETGASSGQGESAAAVLELIGRREQELRREALELGSRVYASKTGELLSRLEKLWSDAGAPEGGEGAAAQARTRSRPRPARKKRPGAAQP